MSAAPLRVCTGEDHSESSEVAGAVIGHIATSDDHPETVEDTPSVLIVEDEPIASAVLENHLRQLNYCVAGRATSGEAAIERCAELLPDIVLMDISLNGAVDGISAAITIRQRFDLPVIFLTVDADAVTIKRARTAEAFGYLLKPVDREQLHTNIEMALYKARADREKSRLLRELQEALAKVKSLSSLLPICAQCKDVRDDEGYWEAVESYLAKTDTQVTHSLCPACEIKFYEKSGLKAVPPPRRHRRAPQPESDQT